MQKAVFLDRDGVINRLVFNPDTGEYESPHAVADLELFPWTLDSLHALRDMGYLLFLISNQPSYAKGKTSMENIRAIHALLHRTFLEHDIEFAEYYYCHHHPNGIVPELTGTCRCRKPGTLFLEEAQRTFNYSTADSWFIGDQDSDIFCGQAYGLRTILINNENSYGKRGKSNPDFHADSLEKAVTLIAGSIHT